MPRTLTILAFLCATGKAFAVLFTGSFTVTLTEVTDMPEYQVGQSFINSFHYEADAMDGTFYYHESGGLPPGENTSLDGQLFWAFPSYYGYQMSYNYDGEIYQGYHNFATGGAASLTVEGGVVTGFTWVTDFGSFVVHADLTYYTTAISNTFYEDENGNFLDWGPAPMTTGTVHFGPIQSDQVPSVPESASTPMLLSVALIAGWAARSRRWSGHVS